MKIALVHDFLREYGGAERVVEAMHEMWPEAPLYTSFVDWEALGKWGERFKNWDIRTSWVQHAWLVKKFISPLRFLAPKIWESFNLSGYDVVISSSGWFMCRGVALRGAEVGMPLSRAVKVQTASSPSSLNSQGRDGTSKGHASPRAHSDPLFLVDAVSSMGNVDIPVDALGLDVVFTSSQKAWMTPPGLAMVSVSPAAWEAYKTAKCRRYYFDFGHMKKYHDKHETPETPAVAALFALRAALRLMLGTGIAETFAYYRELAAYTRKRLTDTGFQLFGDQSHASASVTACLLPEGLTDEDFRGTLKKAYGVVVSGGMGELKGKIFRVAHMGWASREDIDGAVGAMEKVWKKF